MGINDYCVIYFRIDVDIVCCLEVVDKTTKRDLTGLKIIFIPRLLQISSFNGKMNALNEVNKVISSVSYYTHRHNPEEDEWLTAERMAVSDALNRLTSCSRTVLQFLIFVT